MDELLPYYERELAFLRGHSAEFAKKYPKIAGRLQLTGDVGEDPHVERLIESFAFLSSRVHKRIDDDFPELTESLLNVLYPHYLRPFPACSIAKFVLADAGAQLSTSTVLPRGTVLNTRPVKGVPCKFRTAYEVDFVPVNLTQVGYQSNAMLPEGTPRFDNVSSVFSLTFELTSAQAKWEKLKKNYLRLHIDGEASQVAAIRSALCSRVVGVWLQDQEHGAWKKAAKQSIKQVGFEEEESLLDFDERSQPAYRFLTEFFAFSEKFNFVDVPLPRDNIIEGCKKITLHFALSGYRSDSNESALLETATPKNLLLFCTPIVNLFEQKADPIRITHRKAKYPVLPDGRKAFGYQVYAVEKVFRVLQTAHGEQVQEFHPFFSLTHEQLTRDGEDAGRYWSLERNAAVEQVSPGYESEISIVDIDFDPSMAATETLSIVVKATNRDLPSMLSISNIGGDLFMEGGSVAKEVSMLRKPTQPAKFEQNRGALWRLVSHLSLNHLSLFGSGVQAIKELLRLYDLRKSSSNSRLVDGLIDIEYASTSTFLSGKPYPSFVRGVSIKLTVEEDNFVGSGLHLFVSVLDHFFALYVQVNSFTQLTVVSNRTNEELLKCPPRNGNSALL